MPDRVVRSGLLTSDRFVGLPNAVARMGFVVLLLTADDLGTLDASDGQLVRLWRDVCGVADTEAARKLLHWLVGADLVRLYDSEGRRFAFIPNFQPRFRAKTLKRPVPPTTLIWDQPQVEENINAIKDAVAKMTDPRQTAARQRTVRWLTTDAHVSDARLTPAPGVGVGVGVKAPAKKEGFTSEIGSSND